MTERTADSAIVSGSLTRRQVIAGGTVGLCGLAITGVRADAQSATSPKSNEIIATHAIHQVEDFKASPQRIYGALLDSKQFTAFSSGAAAEIDGKVGGTFSIFAGHIIGRNLELCRTSGSCKRGGWFHGPQASIRSPALNWQSRGPALGSLLTTPGFPRSSLSTC